MKVKSKLIGVLINKVSYKKSKNIKNNYRFFHNILERWIITPFKNISWKDWIFKWSQKAYSNISLSNNTQIQIQTIWIFCINFTLWICSHIQRSNKKFSTIRRKVKYNQINFFHKVKVNYFQCMNLAGLYEKLKSSEFGFVHKH